ncbi:Serine/threonine protein kinase [Blastococcus aurantiacus]|uniref:non-specific serine/threonine protein kinase n=1 Tax=Blastococcus aurantiacus TaxID=1550231 RepID=A0A1G7MNP2_9ACTN|nr:serine/threonine-protein kinase [Blastococcus aurantiacus]SDF63311.1 Serine/threonine protein kinase [Blastococcus aurantiacus]
MSPSLTAPGRLVAGRYRLQSQIGGGGMGAVWLARDELLGRQVAVKQVLVSEADEALADQQRQRALREGRIAARLSHPHAISVYDVAQEGETPWLVMEYLPSRSLSEVVAAEGVLRVDQVAQIGAQVADALTATHAAGIVHRDVKPANILIGQGPGLEGLVKITDFGISHAHGDVTLTQTGQITGTPAFLAPEVAQGYEMGEASDVYSLGATLYTCLEGQPPFGMEDNALAMLHKVAGGTIRPPVRAGSLTGPLTRMLASDPAARPTMAEVRDELARLAAGRSGDTTTVLLARTDLRPAGGRPRTEVFPAAGAAAAGAAAGAAAAGAAAADEAPAKAPLPAPPVRSAAAPRTGTPPEAAAPSPPPASAPPAEQPPAAPPAADRPRVQPAPGRTGRRRAIWVAAALLVAALAAVIGFVALRPDDPDRTGTQADDTTSSPTSSPPSSPAPEDEETGESPAGGSTGAEEPDSGSTGTSAADQPTSQPPPGPEPVSDPLSAANIQAFLADYHRQVIQDPASAYDRTGPTLRANIGSREDYIAYWSQFSDVRVSEVQATDGQTQVTGRLDWTFTNGETRSALRRFTLIEQNGQLILDSELDP